MTRPVLSVKPQDVTLELQNKPVVQTPKIVMVDSGKKKLSSLPKVEKSLDQKLQYAANDIQYIQDQIKLRMQKLAQTDPIIHDLNSWLAMVEHRMIPLNAELTEKRKEEKAKKNQ